ncbi:MAG: GTPase [Acidimicrobiales bacterium]
MSLAGRRRGAAGAGLSDRVAALGRAADLAEGRLDEATVAGARHVLDKVEARQRHGTDHTLVALLGATGGGKSSLANAVTGTTVATTGVRRPTTSTTLAFTWGPDETGPLLDWLDVPNRHRLAAEGGAATPLDGLVLLDVPDHDSVALANRQEMERIAELADLMVWVTDAEKYADKAMHGYLRRLREHGGVVALVLNKADQLAPADAERLAADLAQLLADDGLAGAPVLVASATDGRGIPEVRSLLARAVAERRAMVERVVADVRTAASDLLAELGLGADDRGAGEVPRTVARALAADLVEGSGLPAVLDAVAAGHRRDAAARTGWPWTRWARTLRPHPLRRLHLGRGSGGRASLPAPSGLQRARTEGAVRQAVRAVTDPLPHPWPDLVRQAATPDPAVLADRVDQAVAQAVRAETADRPRWWGLANGIQLTVAAAALVGAVWLTLLAAGAWLQLPDVPTPTWRRIPLPTGLLVGGLLLGWLLALGAARLARVGAARRRRAVRERAEDAVADVARDLVVAPLEAELGRLHELRRALLDAGGTRFGPRRGEGAA